MGGISIWQLLIILAIVLIIFGAKRLRGLGADLGASIKGFREAMKEGEQQAEEEKEKKKLEQMESRAIDAEVTKDEAAKERPKV